MTINKALHLRDDVDRLYVSRTDRGRGLASIEDSFDASIGLEDDMRMYERGLNTGTRNDTDNTKINKKIITRKQKLEEKTTLCAF